jgi:hypothetical protein
MAISANELAQIEQFRENISQLLGGTVSSDCGYLYSACDIDEDRSVIGKMEEPAYASAIAEALLTFPRLVREVRELHAALPETPSPVVPPKPAPPSPDQWSKDFADTFSRFVNRGDKHDFINAADQMSHDHRTLQSEMFKMCLLYMIKLDENLERDRVDLRNEWACKTAHKIVEALGGRNEAGMMPFII